MARLTKARKERFLRTLRETGIVRRAVDAASPGAKDAKRTFTQARERDPAFSSAWDDALSAAIGDAEKALWELGVEGVVEREQFDSEGNLRNRVVRRDVRALQLYLAARVPEYRTQRVVESQVKVESESRVRHRHEHEFDLKGALKKLDGEGRANLRTVLRQLRACDAEGLAEKSE